MNITKNSKLLIVLLSVLLVSLSGCDGEYDQPTKSQKLTNRTEHLTTAKGLECVRYKFEGSQKGGAGLSCNWGKYNSLNKAN